MKLENIYYINLDHRKDRKLHVETQLNNLNWQYTRFNACKNKIGELGCTLSHLKLVRMAKEKNLDYIVIVEDDITFKKPKILTTGIQIIVPQVGLLYFLEIIWRTISIPLNSSP